eukprot:1055440-Prymnesium_polylepis.1
MATRGTRGTRDRAAVVCGRELTLHRAARRGERRDDTRCAMSMGRPGPRDERSRAFRLRETWIAIPTTEAVG